MKRIFRYITGTKDIDLWYPRDGDFNLIGYLDVDHAGYKVDEKRTSRYYQLLGHSLVSWHS